MKNDYYKRLARAGDAIWNSGRILIGRAPDYPVRRPEILREAF